MCVTFRPQEFYILRSSDISQSHHSSIPKNHYKPRSIFKRFLSRESGLATVASSYTLAPMTTGYVYLQAPQINKFVSKKFFTTFLGNSSIVQVLASWTAPLFAKQVTNTIIPRIAKVVGLTTNLGVALTAFSLLEIKDYLTRLEENRIKSHESKIENRLCQEEIKKSKFKFTMKSINVDISAGEKFPKEDSIKKKTFSLRPSSFSSWKSSLRKFLSTKDSPPNPLKNKKKGLGFKKFILVNKV